MECKSNFADAWEDALSYALAIAQDTGLHQALQQLKYLLPDPKQSRESIQTWWQTSYPAWMEQLKTAIAKHRNIEHHSHCTPPPAPKSSSGGETKHSFDGVGFFRFNK